MNMMTMNQLVIPLTPKDYSLTYTPGRILGASVVGATVVVKFLSPPDTAPDTCLVHVKRWQVGATIPDGGALTVGDLLITASCFTGDMGRL